MARREARPPAEREVRLTPLSKECMNCGERLWVAYHAQRTLMTFRGLVRLTLVVRRCRNTECELYHLPYRSEEEGAWALPHGEFGLDIITVIGQLRYGEHRSIPEIHQRLVQRGVTIAQRTVTDLLERYEELVALHLADEARIQARLKGASPGSAGYRWDATGCRPRGSLDHPRLFIRRGAVGTDLAQQYARGSRHTAL